MRLSEVIAKLENGSDQKYEAAIDDSGWKAQCGMSNHFFEINIFDRNNKKVSPSWAAGGVNGNIREDLDWQPIPKHVTWQEALNALAAGKSICCELCGLEYRSVHTGFLIEPIMIKEGIWSIE